MLKRFILGGLAKGIARTGLGCRNKARPEGTCGVEVDPLPDFKFSNFLMVNITPRGAPAVVAVPWKRSPGDGSTPVPLKEGLAPQEKGNAPAGVVVFLHGFPDNLYTFKHQMEALSKAGYLCISPAMPGYDPSTSLNPEGFHKQRVADEVHDWVEAIREATGADKVHIVGHSWGALVTELLLRRQPDWFETGTMISNPPSGCLGKCSFKTGWAQLSKVSHLLFNQIPKLPEMWYTSKGPCNGITHIWNAWEMKNTFYSAVRVASVRKTFAKPGVCTSALGYYRGFWKKEKGPNAESYKQPLKVRLLNVHGIKNNIILYKTFICSYDCVEKGFPEGSKYQEAEGERQGHWLMHQEPEWLNSRLLDWLKGGCP